MEKSSIVKASLLAGAVALTGAYFGAEPLTKVLVPPPTMPATPVPEPVQAERSPIDVGVGFDTSRSKIMYDIAEVAGATEGAMRDLLSSGVLGGGDKLTVCEFAETAECKTFGLPGEQTGLMDALSAVAPQPFRKGMKTCVGNSVNQMAARVGDQHPGLLFVWSDAKDECEHGALPPNSPEINVFVPRDEYKANGEEVAEGLGTQKVSVAVTRDGGQFKDKLMGLVGKLRDTANRAAQARADKIYQERLKQYEDEKARKQREFDERRAAYDSKVQSAKRVVRLTTGGTAAIFLTLTAILLRLSSKPRFGKCWVVDKRDPKFPQTFIIPKDRTDEIDIGTRYDLGRSMIAKPTKGGVEVDGRVLRDGDEIILGVYFRTTDPDSVE
jgi:hypothetical protein